MILTKYCCSKVKLMLICLSKKKFNVDLKSDLNIRASALIVEEISGQSCFENFKATHLYVSLC